MRRALQEISSSPFMIRRADPDSNIDMIPESFLTPSPEEQIIRQRSRRLLVHTISLQFDNIENDTDFLKTPSKDDSFMQLKRKRLLLTPPEDTSSPVKCQSRAKKPRLILNENGRSPSSPLSTELKAYSTQQLVDVIDKLLAQHPQLEQEVRRQLPQPDLKQFTEKLQYLRRNVYKALPTSRLGTGRDAAAFKRVKLHLNAFKHELTEQGRTLLFSQSWQVIIKYVLKAWKYVCQLPNWDNPSHNHLKTQCCRMLAAHCMVALRRGTFNGFYLNDVREKVKLAHQMNEEMEPCLKYLEKLLGGAQSVLNY